MQFLRRGEPSREFYCQGPTVWTNLIKYHTTADRVQFLGPLDRSYGNDCEAELTNVFSILIDSANHAVELRVVGKPATGACPRFFAPVSAMSAGFGPLEAGDWVFCSGLRRTSSRISSHRLRTRFELSSVQIEWPAVWYLRYEPQASETLTNWQTIEATNTFDGVLMSVAIQPDTAHRFFRVKRSPISNGIVYYPGGCP